MNIQYFEIDRVIEDLARSSAAPCATTWFKVSGNFHPTIKEYRSKVIDFMNNFRVMLYDTLPRNNNMSEFMTYAMDSLEKAIHEVNSGNNREVEKRFKYFTEYN